MCIIFDLDDTLVDTSDLFWKVREDFISALNISSISADIIREKFEAEDAISIQHLGYHPNRYTQTMLKLLQNYTDNGVISKSKEQPLIDEIKRIGDRISNEPPALIAGAKQCLTELQNMGYSLVLLTRGSKPVQLNKIRKHGLDLFFENIYITDHKDFFTFEGVINSNGFSPADTWIIGDSIKSDINPALALHAKCIHFQYTHEYYNWVYERSDKPFSENYFTTDSLGKIPSIIARNSPRKSESTRTNNKNRLTPS